jgi:hypothetical protein
VKYLLLVYNQLLRGGFLVHLCVYYFQPRAKPAASRSLSQAPEPKSGPPKAAADPAAEAARPGSDLTPQPRPRGPGSDPTPQPRSGGGPAAEGRAGGPRSPPLIPGGAAAAPPRHPRFCLHGKFLNFVIYFYYFYYFLFFFLLL